MKKINVGLDGRFLKELKMAINDMNEYLFEEYANLGFNTQKLAKQIYLYLIGNYNSQTENWFYQYGHHFLCWQNIDKICNEVRITYRQNKKKKSNQDF